MEVTETKNSPMFKDRRTKDRRINTKSAPNKERRHCDRRQNKEFNDAPWWLQRNYAHEALEL